MMGADYYESDRSFETHQVQGGPKIGVGRDCRITRTIIDKNARIGDRVTISPEGKPAEMDGANFFIRDGIVVIPKNAVIPNGTVI